MQKPLKTRKLVVIWLDYILQFNLISKLTFTLTFITPSHLTSSRRGDFSYGPTDSCSEKGMYKTELFGTSYPLL